MEVVAKVLLLQELELVGSALEDQEDVAYESLQKRIARIKASRIVSLWQFVKRLAYGGAALVPMEVQTIWIKCLLKN